MTNDPALDDDLDTDDDEVRCGLTGPDGKRCGALADHTMFGWRCQKNCDGKPCPRCKTAAAVRGPDHWTCTDATCPGYDAEELAASKRSALPSSP